MKAGYYFFPLKEKLLRKMMTDNLKRIGDQNVQNLKNKKPIGKLPSIRKESDKDVSK